MQRDSDPLAPARAGKRLRREMSGSGDIGKRLLHAPKIKGTGRQEQKSHSGAGEDDPARSRSGPEESPAKTLDDSGHWIEPINPVGQSHLVELFRNPAHRIDHRSHEEPELNEKGDHIPNV